MKKITECEIGQNEVRQDEKDKCRQMLLDAVQAGEEETAKELLWQTVIAYQGCPFKTVSYSSVFLYN